MSDQTDLLQGTLDLLIMRTIALEPLHGWAIAQRIQQISDELLRVQQGSLYPGAAPPRASGLDRGRVGRLRQQPPRAVLFAHARRPQAAHDRGLEVGAAVGRRQPRAAEDLARAHLAHRSRAGSARCSFAAGARPTSVRSCVSTSIARPNGWWPRSRPAPGAPAGAARVWQRRGGERGEPRRPRHDVRRTPASATRGTPRGGCGATGASPLAAVLILGLGIGVNAAIFSVINAVLFRPQAVVNPDTPRGHLSERPRRWRPTGSSYAAYLDMAAYTDIFAGSTP